MICPFYGKNEDYCDVGCGYISPHDVETIIQFCSAHHEQCRTFQKLMEFHPEVAVESALSTPTPLSTTLPKHGADKTPRRAESPSLDQETTSATTRKHDPADKRYRIGFQALFMPDKAAAPEKK